MPSSLTPQLPSVRSAHSNSAAKTQDYVFSQLIPYIGNKRKLLGLINDAIALTQCKYGVFADLFAGSGVVSRFAKKLGFQVIANDWEPYSFEINNCFVASNEPPRFAKLGGHAATIESLNALAPERGWVSEHLCPLDDDAPDQQSERMFFTASNGMKIDAIRSKIQEWESAGLIDCAERSYLLAPLLFATSYVSNTSGVFKGFHNGWGGKTGTALYRILSDIYLRVPVLYDNGTHCESWSMDAQTAAETLRHKRVDLDIAYLDPPYNQHPYGSNYHVLNSIALWDKPRLSKQIERGTKSAIRTDWRTDRRSSYNYRSEATNAFSKLIQTLNTKWIIISYSTDGIIKLRDMLEICAERGQLSCVMRKYKRYRVSTPRMSLDPMTVEFVLVIKTGSSCKNSTESIHSEILRCKNTGELVV